MRFFILTLLKRSKKIRVFSLLAVFPFICYNSRMFIFKTNTPYELSAPVTSPNKRLGTLIMFYKPAPILPDSLNSQ